MKYHMMKPKPWHFDIDDSFQTWCGISDHMNVSEEAIEHFVTDWKNCDCKKCKQAYERDIKEFEKQQKELNKALK